MPKTGSSSLIHTAACAKIPGPMSQGRKQIIRTPRAPGAIGPYSQGVVSGGFLFLSGQIPLDPATGKLAQPDIGAQTRRCLDNLSAVLVSAGTSLSSVVKTTVYLTNLSDFPAMNAVYATYFPADPPARSTVQVAALPLGAAIEIDAIAQVP